MAHAVDPGHIPQDVPGPADRARALADVRDLKSEIPLIAANGVTLMLASTILYFKLKDG